MNLIKNWVLVPLILIMMSSYAMEDIVVVEENTPNESVRVAAQSEMKKARAAAFQIVDEIERLEKVKSADTSDTTPDDWPFPILDQLATLREQYARGKDEEIVALKRMIRAMNSEQIAQKKHLASMYGVATGDSYICGLYEDASLQEFVNMAVAHLEMEKQKCNCWGAPSIYYL